MAWQFEWQRSWSKVWAEDFQQNWRALLTGAPQTNVYHRPEVVRSWVETCGEEIDAQPCFGVARHSKGHCLLMPWIIVTYAGRLGQRRVLEPAGQSFFGYHSPLVVMQQQEKLDWTAFWLAVRHELRDVCDQALFRFLDEKQAQGVMSESCTDQNPMLNFDGVNDFATLLERCSTNHRGDIRRRMRRMAECGEVSLWIPAKTEVEAARSDFVERFLPAYDEIWGTRPTGNMFHQTGVMDFATRVLTEGLANGWAHYSVLKVAGEPVAWHLGLIDQAQLYWWIPTHASRWNDFSPGKVLLAKLIQQGITEGWTRLHFQTGGHHYKLAWANEDARLRTIRWQSPTLKGKILSFYDGVLATRKPRANA